MANIIIISILIIGFSGIAAQIILLRELLISYLGNELVIGIILANWLAAEALGVYLFGKFIDKAKNKFNIFIVLTLIFSSLFPILIYLSRTFKNLLGIIPGEAIGLVPIFFSSFLILFPAAFLHASLFSVTAKIFSLTSKNKLDSVAKTYFFEILGTIIGGILLTFLLLPKLNSFIISGLIGSINCLYCLAVLKFQKNKILKLISLGICIFFILMLANGNFNSINRISIDKQFSPEKVLNSQNSIYGNITVTENKTQHTFFYNGLPFATTPIPDINFVEEYGNLPLLFNDSPDNVLIISAGSGGLINETLKHPVKRIDYCELDPLIIKLVSKYGSLLTQNELTNKKVHISNIDGRLFVNRTKNKYDIILIGLSKPTDLSSNRVFSADFFALCKTKLKNNGLIALNLPGSLAYLSQELKDLNNSIINALRINYKHLKIIPGDYNIILASDSSEISQLTADDISQRITKRKINSNLLVPDYLKYRLEASCLDWFNQSMLGATSKINQDTRPIAVFQMLIFWNKQFSLQIANLLNKLTNLNNKILLFIILGLTLILLFIPKKIKYKFSVTYCIFTSGFFGMLINLILIFSFQVSFGYIFQIIGLLVSIFMAGACLGSTIIIFSKQKIRNYRDLFIKVEYLIIAYTLATAFFCAEFYKYFAPLAIYFILLFISGLLIGLQFYLSTQLFRRKDDNIGETAGTLYFADLAGGWIAGIFGGLVLIPVLGIFNSCLVIIFIKLSSFFLLIKNRQ